MKEDKPASDKAVSNEAEAKEAVVEEATPVESSPAAVEGGTAVKSTGEKVRAFITPERILGLVAILLIPCFFTAWVHLPITEKVGIKVELSMPEALSTGQSAVTALENVGDVITEVKAIADTAVDYIDEAVNVLSAVTTVLNNDTAENKAALTAALSALIDQSIDGSSSPAAAAVESAATNAAGKAVDKGVDKAQSSIEGTQAQETIDKAAEASVTATQNAKDVQDKAKEVQGAVTEAKAQYDSGLQTVKTILGVATFVWYAFLLLLLVAGILLIVGVRGRYVTGIVAFAMSTVASLAAIIGISVANQAILDAITSALGVWVLGFVSSVIAVTAWPWVVAIVSILCLVVIIVLMTKRRKALKAAEAKEGQTPLKPVYVESAEPEAAEA